jgi:hypothetical protein
MIFSVLNEKLIRLHRTYAEFLEKFAEGKTMKVDLVRVYSEGGLWKGLEHQARATRLAAVIAYVRKNENELKPYFTAWESWKFRSLEHSVFETKFKVQRFNFRITCLDSWKGVLSDSRTIREFRREFQLRGGRQLRG